MSRALETEIGLIFYVHQNGDDSKIKKSRTKLPLPNLLCI